jgi:hypothetical protein
VSATPLQGTRSKRTSLRAAKADDALARDKECQISRKLEQLGLITEGETPTSLGALLRQAGTPSVGDINSGFGDDDFGGFDGEVMDYDSDSEWEVESGDEIEDKLKQSTEKLPDYAIRTQKEVDNWTGFIAIVTGDTAMQECSPFCTCSKSTRSIPTVSLSAGVLNRSLSLTVKDISTWNFKYARRVALFVRVCSISSVKDIIRRLRSNLVLHSTWMSFFSSTRCT